MQLYVQSEVTAVSIAGRNEDWEISPSSLVLADCLDKGVRSSIAQARRRRGGAGGARVDCPEKGWSHGGHSIYGVLFWRFTVGQ